MRKDGVKPTLKEKKMIVQAGLELDMWLVQKKDDEFLYVVHRLTKAVKPIPYSS